MKINIIRTSIGLLIWSFLIYNWYRNHELKTENNSSIRENLLKNYKNKLSISFDLFFLKVSDITLKNLNSEEFKLKEITSDRPKLIYCFSGSGCNSCIKHEINKIKKVFAKRHEQVLLIMTNSNMENPRKLFLFKKNNQLDFPIYYSAKLSNIRANNFYFILKSTGEITLPFISTKDFPDLTENYLQLVKSKVINNDISL